MHIRGWMSGWCSNPLRVSVTKFLISLSLLHCKETGKLTLFSFPSRVSCYFWRLCVCLCLCICVCSCWGFQYLQTLHLQFCDLLDVFAGISFFPLDKMTYLKIQSFVNRVEENLSLIKYTAFLYNDQLIWYLFRFGSKLTDIRRMLVLTSANTSWHSAETAGIKQYFCSYPLCSLGASWHATHFYLHCQPLDSRHKDHMTANE